MDRRTVLKGGLVMAATAHTAINAPEIPKRSLRDQAEYHLSELKALMEEETGKSFHGEIAWDVDSAFLFGRTTVAA